MNPQGFETNADLPAVLRAQLGGEAPQTVFRLAYNSALASGRSAARAQTAARKKVRELEDLAKYDPNQPRDELGRWTAGGGIGGVDAARRELRGYTPKPAASASELYARTVDPTVTPDAVLGTLSPDTRAEVAAIDKALAEGRQSQMDHTGPDGKYTPEREALHDSILGRILNEDDVARATPPEGEAPTLVVLGGRGGSGKSWFTSSADSPVDASKFLTINSDDIKEALPEYKGWNAGLLHEESSDIAARAHRVASSVGVNVIYDATMRSTGSVSRVIDDYVARGYRVEGYFMHTAPQVSAMRALNRFKTKGRYVPPSYILSSTSNERTFDAMATKMKKWAVYDNNGRGGPTRVAQGGM